MEIGSKLKEARKACGMTQEDVADSLGVSRQSISNWENSRTFPDIISVVKMSDLYEISLDVLLKDQEENQKEEKVMNKYLDFLDESTNTVKSKERQSQLILLLTYLVVWALGIMIFWFFTKDDQAMGFALIYLWILLPVTTLVISIIIGKRNYWGNRKWLSTPIFGCLYMLAEYATFSAANMVAFQKINTPDWNMILTGSIIALLGLAIGTLAYKLKKKRQSLHSA